MLQRRGFQRVAAFLGLLLLLWAGTLLTPLEASHQRPIPDGSPSRPQAPVPTLSGEAPPQIAGCSVFPADNIWNVPIDTLPVDPNSDLYIATIGAEVGVHPDFGSGLYEGKPIGIPFVDVPATQAGVPVSFEYEDESDPGPYPIPSDPPIEGGPDGDGDRHVLVLERENCILYELFYAFPQEDGSWEAGSGAIYDLTSHDLRPDGWTSADAAGLPILPGLVRYDEVAAGEIRHALRFTVPETRRDYVWPARHFASSLTEQRYPPMGQRFRLRADFDISDFSPEVQVILRALKKYGMMLADNGSPWYISGAPDEQWDNDVLRELRQVRGADFEAVDVSSLQINVNSGQVRAGGTGGTLLLYLPLVRKSAAPSAPTATPTATATTGLTATATATRTATATSTHSTAATATPSRTPTATRSTINPNLFVDDDNETGTENGSENYPYTTVQAAINAASDGATIAVAGGTYAQNIRVQNKSVRLYGGYEGGTASDYAGGAGGNFDVRDPAANLTHLQGNGKDSVVNLLESGATVVDGFRVTGGARSVEPLPACRGGGFYIFSGAPILSNNLIENNSTCPFDPEQESFGGGIDSNNAAISILNNVIRNNTSGRGAGISINGGEVVIRGNTVEGNIGLSDHGGGIYIFSPDAEVSNNRIVGNEIGRELGYGWGGGLIVVNEGAFATLSYNVYTDNYAPSIGSAVFVDEGANTVLDHELIYANDCGPNGGVGAIYVDGNADGTGSTVTILHTTVASHNCDPAVAGNAVTVEGYSDVTIRNSIFWGNGGDDVAEVDATTETTVSYTLSEEEIAGTGNLSTNPLFADPVNNDYRLRSTGGRWDPDANGGAGAWVVDAQHSPAIDAGDPASPYAAEPAPNGGRANMGAYGNTSQASKSAQ